jgi:hypothetical protein
LREQTTAREDAEQLLQEAQATILALETKLAHERMSRDQAAGERQSVANELAAGSRLSRSATRPL